MNDLIYLICPVRKLTKSQKKEIDQYIKMLKSQGKDVKCPYSDTDQDDEVGLRIVKEHEKDILERDNIHIYWDPTSTGSLWDLAQVRLAQMLGIEKKILWINTRPDLIDFGFIWDCSANIKLNKNENSFRLIWKHNDKVSLWKMAQIRMLKKLRPDIGFFIKNIKDLDIDSYKSYKNVMIATALGLKNCFSRDKLKKKLNKFKRRK